MFVSIPNHARQCELIRKLDFSRKLHVTLCTGICGDKVGDVFGVPHTTHHICSHPLHGTAWIVQADMVVAQTKENMAGQTKYHRGKYTPFLTGCSNNKQFTTDLVLHIRLCIVFSKS